MNRRKLDKDLVLRNVENENDVLRFAEFNAVCNNAVEGATSECLLKHYPGLRWEDAYLIEDVAADRIVATICRIPWQIDLEGVRLKAAQLEMVLSHPEYRNRGLVRVLISQFLEDVAAEDYDMSFIWGIPYYYRQYGYSYGLYGNIRYCLPAAHIPDSGEEETLALEPATLQDIAALAGLYSATVGQDMHMVRDEADWCYLIRDARHPVWMVRDRRRGPCGYLFYRRQAGGSLCVMESGIPNPKTGLAVLRLLKKQVTGTLEIMGHEDDTLLRLARDLGCVENRREQWLLRITDIPVFLKRIGPVLEKRLAASAFGGVTEDLVINLYRRAYRLCFISGRLAGVRDLGFKDSSMGADGGDVCIPLDAFVRLLFGFRRLEQLVDAWPDIAVKPESRCLLETIFPEIQSYVNTPYHYLEELP